MAGKDGTGQAGVTAAELWPPLWKPSARWEEVNQGSHQEDKQTPMCCHHSKAPAPWREWRTQRLTAQGTRNQ